MEIHNIYTTSEYFDFEEDYFWSMLNHQKVVLREMRHDNRLTICMPTGTGKSRIIYGDLLRHLKLPTCDTFVIASHRLLLNVQHFNELFSTFEILASTIGFIFVGSQGVDTTELQKNVSVNQKLADAQLSYPELISTCLSKSEIKTTVDRHHAAGRDVIIISTYHSLDKLENIDVHTLYCDEAHFLATPKEIAQFKNNFEKVNATRKFFFTATPKDLVVPVDVIDEEDQVDLFLMNNESVFGKRIGVAFKEAVEECLIVKPYVHMIELDRFSSSKKYSSSENYAKVIDMAFEQHEKTLKDLEKCAPKLLVKCPSVAEIWKIKEALNWTLKEGENPVKIFAGASHSPYNSSFWVDDEPIQGKTQFLKKLQELKGNERAIILHYDILSEGIDVPGITGVMFLSKELPGKPKILQTIGRSTRLLKEDREAVRSGKIAKNDYEKMIKPHCAVILPIMSIEMDQSAKSIAKILIDLRDQFGFKPEVYVESGEDVSKGQRNTELEGVNTLDEKKERFSVINSVKHYIEILDNEKVVELENEEILKLQGLAKKDKVEFVREFGSFLKNNI